MSETRREPRTVLILSFQYWPALSARAFRWTALAEDWVSKGYRVHIVCSRLSGRPAFEAVNGVQIHRVGSWFEGWRGSGARAAFGDAARRDFLRRAASAASRTIWHRVYWPDTFCTWYFSARHRARELIEASNPEAVVSVSPAFTAVAVGYSLARRAPRPFRWIIDLGDPFSFAEEAPQNNFHLYRELNTRFERSCFAAADSVSVTNPDTRDRYAEIFPESAEKIEVIPPMISLPPAEGLAGDRGDTPGARKLVFLGRLYPTIRRPDFLLALFAALTDSQPGRTYELHFYGESLACAKSFEPYRQLIGRTIFLHDPVPRSRVVEQMRSAHTLVNIGNATGYQLPSKIVEYAASGKPILNIAAVADDSSARFLADYPAHLTLAARVGGPTHEDVGNLGEFLAQAPERVSEPDLREWLTPFTLPEISPRYLSLLSREPRTAHDPLSVSGLPSNLTAESRAPVSVVVPCFRCTETILRAVASLARQSLVPDELILIDDASGDGTLGQLMDLQREFGEAWVKVIALDRNCGPSGARNAGWAAASGKYVAFLDADDAWHPRKMEIQHAFMEAHPEVALCGHSHRRLRDGDSLNTPLGRSGFRMVSLGALLLSNRFHPTSAIVRRDIPLRFPVGKKYMEDHLLWIQIASEGRQVARLDEVLSFTFKPPLGASGLSTRTWEMRKGELANYWTLRRSGRLGLPATLCLSAYSLAKHLVRLLLLAVRRERLEDR